MLEFFLGLALTIPIAAPVSALIIGNTRLDVAPIESWRQMKNRRRQRMIDQATEWRALPAGQERPYLWDDYLKGDADFDLATITYGDMHALVTSEKKRYNKQFNRLAETSGTTKAALIAKWTTYNELDDSISLGESQGLPITQEIADEFRVQLLKNRATLNEMFRTEDEVTRLLNSQSRIEMAKGKVQNFTTLLARVNTSADMRQKKDEAFRLFVAPENQFKALLEGKIL